jgi:site-specific recombinase XerD
MTKKKRSILTTKVTIGQGCQAQEGFVPMIEDYLESCKGRGIKPKTLDEYRRNLLDYAETIGETDVTDPDHAQAAEKAFFEIVQRPSQIDGMPISQATYNRKLTYIKSFYNWLIRRRRLKVENPFMFIDKRTEPTRLLPFSPEIITKIEDDLWAIYEKNTTMIHLRNYLVFVMLSTVGARGGELGKFTRADIKLALDPPQIELMAAYTKTAEARYLTLPYVDRSLWGKSGRRARQKSRFQTAFEAYYETHSQLYMEDEPFFITQKGEEGSAPTWRKVFKPLFEKHGVPDAHVHDLRRFALTRLAEAGMNAFQLQRVAGHKTITMTSRYVTPSISSVGHAVQDALRVQKTPDFGSSSSSGK